jgi:hypothetical protein
MNDDLRSECEDGTISAGNSAILPDFRTTSSGVLDLNASTQSAYGLPSPERMNFWSSDGKLKNAPVSQITDGARSIMEHSLEQHMAFRTKQRHRMEMDLEQTLDKKRLEQMMSSEMFRQTMSGSKTLTSDRTSLSEANGSIEEQNKSLKTSFRPKSAY